MQIDNIFQLHLINFDRSSGKIYRDQMKLVSVSIDLYRSPVQFDRASANPYRTLSIINPIELYRIARSSLLDKSYFKNVGTFSK